MICYAVTIMNTYKTRAPEKRLFCRSLLSLVIPITIQNLITHMVNSADVLMLNYVGQSSMSAVSLANQYQFILGGFFFGITSGTTMLCAQYWGKKDLDSIQAVFGIALKISLTFTLILSLAAVSFPALLMRVFTPDPELIGIGASYLRVMGTSYLLTGFSQTYLCVLKSVERAKTSTLISCSALFLNVFLNAVFIFGLLGAPKLGAAGVALATLIARIVEILLCLVDFFKGHIFRPDFSVLFGRHKPLFQDFLKYSIPALLNDCIWTFAFSTYSIILGHMNSDMVAASSVATTIRDLLTVVCYGLGGAGTVLLGKSMGEMQMDKAKREAGSLCRCTLAVSILTGLIIILVRRPVIGIFDLTPQAQDYLNFMLLVSSYYVVGQAMNTLTIAGIFRAGGNSRFGLICDIITMWVVAVPLGFISAFVLHLPPKAVYFILCLDEFWKVPVVYRYYKSEKWLNNITREYE